MRKAPAESRRSNIIHLHTGCDVRKRFFHLFFYAFRSGNANGFAKAEYPTKELLAHCDGNDNAKVIVIHFHRHDTFVNWMENGDVVSTDATYSFTVTANRNLVATFSRIHVCAGNLTRTEAKAATCSAAGNTAYYTCTCGKYYQDAEAKMEIEQDSWVVTDADAHDWNEPTYTQQDGKHVAHYVCKLDGTHTKQNDPADHVYSAPDYTCVCEKSQQFTVTFNTDGGSAVAPITQDYNTEVTAPKNPTKDGYVFAGWVDEDGSSVSFPMNMPLGGMKLAAVWEKIPDLPKTGDHSSMLLWFMLLGMAGAAMLFLRRGAQN